MQGTDLDWFRRLRAGDHASKSPPPAESRLSTISAPSSTCSIHAALGMAIYTGRLNLKDLEPFVSL